MQLKGKFEVEESNMHAKICWESQGNDGLVEPPWIQVILSAENTKADALSKVASFNTFSIERSDS